MLSVAQNGTNSRERDGRVECVKENGREGERERHTVERREGGR